jgi:gluconokinase
VSTAPESPCIVSLDVGSSSVRALLYDAGARQMEGYGAALPYRIQTTPDGGAEANPDQLCDMAVDCLDEVHRQARESGLQVIAVAGSAFWHGLMGVDAGGKPTIPVLHLLDTRSASFVEQTPDAHGRTGCPRHSSYWPSKLLWLRAARPDAFAATARWMTFSEYLWCKLFGHPHLSLSMASGTGLWNPRRNEYDGELLEALGVRREQLSTPCDDPEREPKLWMWPGFQRAAWFPALGDGALSNAGTGCVQRESFALTVGTTGAMRAVVEAAPEHIPEQLWCYRLDSRRLLVGGALSNGGDVYAWCKRTLALPKDIEARLDKATPGTHGLTFLPFFSGERTPYWRDDLRAAITGMTFATEAIDMLRAGMESVALGFREIYDLLESCIGTPTEMVASGGGLLRSPAWTQMMADALGRPVTASTELEPSARGAVVWALEQLKRTESLSALPASTGATFEPRAEHRAAWDELTGRRRALFSKLFGENPLKRDRSTT